MQGYFKPLLQQYADWMPRVPGAALTLLAFSIISFSGAVFAAEPEPGDSCLPAQQHHVKEIAGPDNPDTIYTLVCNGSTWQPILEWDKNTDKRFMQTANDSGSCTYAKAGRMSYNSTSKSWLYCNGSSWVSFTDKPVDSCEMGTWIATDLPVIGHSWFALAYGAGRFVALSYNTSNVFITSTDGVNWIQGTLPESRSWRRVVYGNGRFIATAETWGPKALTSTDGLTWSVVDIPFNSNLIAFGNERFVLYSTTTVAVSTDGINWTTAANPNTAVSVRKIIFGAERFVAIPLAPGTHPAMTSVDGLSWTPSGMLPGGMGGNTIDGAYGNGMFVVTGINSGTRAISVDGLTWTAHSPSSYLIGSNQVIASDGRRFVFLAGANLAQYGSMDENMFDEIGTLPVSQAWQAITYGGGRFVAIGANRALRLGCMNGGVDETPSVFNFSIKTNQALNSPITSNTVNITGITAPVQVSVSGDGGPQVNINNTGWVTSGVIEAGQSLQVRLTSANTMGTLRSARVYVGTVMKQWDVTTLDGACILEWGETVTPYSNQSHSWRYGAYDGSSTIAYLPSGSQTPIYSTDGIYWNQAVQLSLSTTWNSIAYGNGRFVGIASNGTTGITSTDAANWTWYAGIAGEAGAKTNVAFGAGRFVALRSGSNRYVTTTDGTTWTAGNLPESRTWNSLAYGAGRFVGAMSGTRYVTSTDGLTWTAGDMPLSNSWMLHFVGGQFFAFHGLLHSPTQHYYLRSTDGLTWTQHYFPSLPDTNVRASIAYGGGRYLMFYTNANRYLTSVDGINWIIGETPTTEAWDQVQYAHGRFIMMNTSLDRAIIADCE